MVQRVRSTRFIYASVICVCKYACICLMLPRMWTEIKKEFCILYLEYIQVLGGNKISSIVGCFKGLSIFVRGAFEPRHEKTDSVVFEQVRQKPSCTSIEYG